MLVRRQSGLLPANGGQNEPIYGAVARRAPATQSREARTFADFSLLQTHFNDECDLPR